jgi:hypothetical protein
MLVWSIDNCVKQLRLGLVTGLLANRYDLIGFIAMSTSASRASAPELGAICLK